jgi:hypothetical protein
MILPSYLLDTLLRTHAIIVTKYRAQKKCVICLPVLLLLYFIFYITDMFLVVLFISFLFFNKQLKLILFFIYSLFCPVDGDRASLMTRNLIQQ